MRNSDTDYEYLIGKPVESLQTFLRAIAFYYEDLPKVIPDGIFGIQTENAVRAFQIKFEMPETGEVDWLVWEKVIEVYDGVTAKTTVDGSVFPNEWFTVGEGDYSEHIRTMQAMLKAISDKYDNLTDIDITGVHDEKSQRLVREVQELFAMEVTGIIDSELWQRIERMYINEVVNDIFYEDV